MVLIHRSPPPGFVTAVCVPPDAAMIQPEFVHSQRRTADILEPWGQPPHHSSHSEHDTGEVQ